MPVGLRLVTFNVQYGRSASGRIDAGLLGRTCAGLDADVLGLQEVDVRVWRSRMVDQAAAVADATGMAHAFGPARRMPWGGRHGNALLARGRLADVEVVALPRGGDRPRSVVVARAEVGGVGLSVAVAHLAVDHAAALAQLDVVVAVLDRRPPPRVLLGDLNLHPDEVRPRVEAAGFRLADGGPTFPAGGPWARIDHVAVTGLSVGPAMVTETPVSDHRPLAVEVAVIPE